MNANSHTNSLSQVVDFVGPSTGANWRVSVEARRDGRAWKVEVWGRFDPIVAEGREKSAAAAAKAMEAAFAATVGDYLTLERAV